MDNPVVTKKDSTEAASTALATAAANGILTIDLDALVSNWRKLESRAVPAECAAVVKGNAYGCGAGPVARALAFAGCSTFFVATLSEARALREVAPIAIIYVLNGFFPNSGDAYAQIGCRPVIGDLAELAEWDMFCRTTGWSGGCAIHVDTGMSRLGLTLADAQGLSPRIQSGAHGFKLVMSHLACAELPDHPLNARQLDAFREVAHLFSGIPASIAASSGIFLGPQYTFEMVRPGAALYGINPTPEADNPMTPVIGLTARIAQIRTVEKGDTVGYGAAWTARRASRIAILSVGYADGYFRAAGGGEGKRNAEVMIGGERCSIVGRISMDLLAVDITELSSGAAKRGQMATLIGDGITLEELGHHFGTIGYEVLTSLGPRYHRIYREVGADKQKQPAAEG